MMMPTPYRFAAALAALLLAVQPGAAQALVAQPIASVLEAPIALTELTPRSATLRVTSTIDLACVVAYGTDERFGRLAFDQNMGAAAHREHRVVLRGLEPATEVRYRLQGSAEDGTFYASEVLSFRTPDAAAERAFGENVATLASGARVTAVSSEYGPAFTAANALDGDPDTEWSSRGDGDAAFVTVELPEPMAVTGFGLWTRTMGSSAQIRRFEVVNEHGQVFGPFALPDAAGPHRFEARGRGQRFTFRVLDSTGGNTGAVELEVFAPAEPSALPR